MIGKLKAVNNKESQTSKVVTDKENSTALSRLHNNKIAVYMTFGAGRCEKTL